MPTKKPAATAAAKKKSTPTAKSKTTAPARKTTTASAKKTKSAPAKKTKPTKSKGLGEMALEVVEKVIAPLKPAKSRKSTPKRRSS